MNPQWEPEEIAQQKAVKFVLRMVTGLVVLGGLAYVIWRLV